MDKVTTGPEDNRGRQANHHSNAIVLKQKGSRVGKKDASMRLSTQVCISRPRCASLDHCSTGLYNADWASLLVSALSTNRNNYPSASSEDIARAQ